MSGRPNPAILAPRSRDDVNQGRKEGYGESKGTYETAGVTEFIMANAMMKTSAKRRLVQDTILLLLHTKVD
jgi:hypothetical protein